MNDGGRPNLKVWFPVTTYSLVPNRRGVGIVEGLEKSPEPN